MGDGREFVECIKIICCFRVSEWDEDVDEYKHNLEFQRYLQRESGKIKWGGKWVLWEKVDERGYTYRYQASISDSCTALALTLRLKFWVSNIFKQEVTFC